MLNKTRNNICDKMEKKGIVFWFTGRPGSGKTSLINSIIPDLKRQHKVEVLDGDELRFRQAVIVA